MEDLVLSIEQCKHLQELGLDMRDAKCCWRRQTSTWDGNEPKERYKRWRIEKNQAIIVQNFESYEDIPTYTLQEILYKLPKRIGSYKLKQFNWEELYYIFDGDRDSIGEDDLCLYEVEGNDFFDSAYQMLCWVIENGYLETK